MYILFINLGGNIFFSLNLIIIKIIQPMGSTWPNPIHVSWVEKSPQLDPTRPMHTPTYITSLNFIMIIFIIIFPLYYFIGVLTLLIMNSCWIVRFHINLSIFIFLIIDLSRDPTWDLFFFPILLSFFLMFFISRTIFLEKISNKKNFYK